MIRLKGNELCINEVFQDLSFGRIFFSATTPRIQKTRAVMTYFFPDINNIVVTYLYFPTNMVWSCWNIVDLFFLKYSQQTSHSWPSRVTLTYTTFVAGMTYEILFHIILWHFGTILKVTLTVCGLCGKFWLKLIETIWISYRVWHYCDISSHWFDESEIVGR